MMNALITQRRMCYANIQMNVFAIANVLITQLGTSCTFDSPGLTSESEGYPGLFAVSGNNAVGVDLLTTRITQGRLMPTLGYQRYNAFSVELQTHRKLS